MPAVRTVERSRCSDPQNVHSSDAGSTFVVEKAGVCACRTTLSPI
jgi:hypothetical protein